MRIRIGLLVAVMAMRICVGGETEAPPMQPAILTVPLVRPGPNVDGEIQPGEWQGPTVRGFYNKEQLFEPRGGSFQLACDGNSIYLAVDSPLHPRYGALTRRRQSGDAGQIFLDDAVEFWLAPGLEGAPARIFQLVFNTANRVAMQSFDSKTELFSPAQKPKALSLRSGVFPGRWTAELSIPLVDLGMGSASEGCRIRVGRSYKIPFIPTITSPNPGAYTDLSTMVRVKIVEQSATVCEPDWQQQAPALSLSAPKEKSCRLSVNGNEHTIPAGEQSDVPLIPRSEADGTQTLDLLVSDEEGKVLHRRSLRWKKPEGEIWDPVL
ncbi:MAG: hypothetical protein HQL31_01375 [Planctomycetes bacterium]|nr:hypothetical protein [Planctomycetota bacterium]